jgi:hypothetical protein
MPTATLATPAPSSLLASQFLDQMTRREHHARATTRLRTLLALAIIAAILAVLPTVFLKAAHFFDALPPDDKLMHLSRWQFITINATLLLLTFPLALATRRESRSDTISQFLDAQNGPHADSPNALAMRIVLTIACLGLFQGEFLLIDAVKDSLLRLRLTGIDRDRAATILAQLHSTPAGLDPRLLIRHRESPQDFRKIIAYLLTHQWADVSPKADHLTLLSPARRALRS